MTRICSWFNPFSTKFHSCEEFKDLKGSSQIVCVALTALVAIITLCTCAVPLFRFLVRRFKKMEESAANPAIGQIARTHLPPITASPTKASVFNDAKKPAGSSKKVDVDSFDKSFPKQGGVSKRTKKCIEKLEATLKKQGKKLCPVEDSGDCFYMAFAIGLMLVRGEEVTVANAQKWVTQLRLDVYEYIQTVRQKKDVSDHRQDPIEALIEEQYDAIDAYEDYCTRVKDTVADCTEDKIPIWGRESIEGVILCKKYKVHLRVIEGGAIDGEPIENPKTFFIDTKTYPMGMKFGQTVEIALYPGHFLGIVPA